MGFYEDNIRIFEESRRLWETDPALRAAAENSIAQTRLALEGDAVPVCAGERRFGERVRVTVSGRRSFQAAADYRSRRVCVLNFASATQPGGGVVIGANAQEECLCRCSTLYPCLDTPAMWAGFYAPHRAARDPLHNDDCIYTPGVTVFRRDDATAALLPPDGRCKVDVLTCAAPDLRGAAVSGASLRALLTKRARRILDLAAEQGAEALVLGAFGCGVFQNDPKMVAGAFRTALEERAHCFEAAEFAVAGREENYRAFLDAFAGWE